jgi:hypothetical protein
MHFNDLPRSDKIAMVNIAATLLAKGFITIKPECLTPGEIIDALIPAAEDLFKNSSLSKNS